MRSIIIFSALFFVSLGCTKKEFRNRLENSSLPTSEIYPSPCGVDRWNWDNCCGEKRLICDPYDVLGNRTENFNTDLQEIIKNPNSPIHVVLVRNIFPIPENVDEFAEKLLQRYQTDKEKNSACSEKIGGLFVIHQSPDNETCASTFYVLDNAIESRKLLAKQQFRIYGEDGCENPDIIKFLEKMIRGMSKEKNEKPPIYGVTPPEEISGIHFEKDWKKIDEMKLRNPMASAFIAMIILIGILLVFFTLGWYCGRGPYESLPSRKIVPAKKVG